MSPILTGIGGSLIGLALGWYLGMRAMARAGPGPELEARQRALEGEQERLARELSRRDDTLGELSHAADQARELTEENRQLKRRILDLEAALSQANSAVDLPSEALEMQLVMALRERDAAHQALMELEARSAIERTRPPPDPDDFPELPEPPDDTDEVPGVSSAQEE